MTTTLSERLRTETKVAHTAAERSGVMRSLLRGTISRERYITLLHNLSTLYCALETELSRHHAHPALALVDWAKLRRLPALEKDLECFASQLPPEIANSTNEYAARLRELGATEPGLLFAHAYLRYLGDLYGGQIIKRIVGETFDETNSATSFYDFPEIDDIETFKETFHEAINSIPEFAADPDALVREVQHGYELHARIFEEIEPHQPTEAY